jgi:hypothetical protein
MLNFNGDSGVMQRSEDVVSTDLHEPVPGYWYINRTGKLMRVRFVTFGVNGMESVLIQYIEGSTQTISIDDWRCLDLVIPRYDLGDIRLESDSTL